MTASRGARTDGATSDGTGDGGPGDDVTTNRGTRKQAGARGETAEVTAKTPDARADRQTRMVRATARDDAATGEETSQKPQPERGRSERGRQARREARGMKTEGKSARREDERTR